MSFLLWLWMAACGGFLFGYVIGAIMATGAAADEAGR